METIRFETGKTYYGFWAADSSTEYEFTIAARTPGFVTLQHGTVAEQKRVRVRIVEGVEQCSPFGAYSMSPVLRADRVAK